MSFRCLLSPRLAAVVRVAQRLPIALIPKQLLITTPRDHVINALGWCASSLRLTHHAQGVLQTVQLGPPTPSLVVSSLRCSASPIGLALLAVVAVQSPAYLAELAHHY
jgi:hypothetical protein